MAVRSFGGHSHGHDHGHGHADNNNYGLDAARYAKLEKFVGKLAPQEKYWWSGVSDAQVDEIVAAAPADGVHIPEFVDTLEWTLDCPPNVHEFTEPPVSYSFECSCCVVIFLSDHRRY